MRGSTLALLGLALAACGRGDSVDTDLGTEDPGSDSGSATDSDPGSDTGSDSGTDAPDLTWRVPERAYRLTLQLTGSPEVDGHVVETFVDLRAALDELGDVSPALLDSLVAMAIIDDVANPIPCQFLDGFAGLLDKAPSADPLDDERGGLVLLTDDLPPLTSLTVELYFDSAASTTGSPVDITLPLLAVTDTQISSGGTVADFDPARGGMLSSLVWDSSYVLASLADAAYGNSLSTAQGAGSWQIDPQDAPGALEVLVAGPVVAGLRASGLRADAQGGYSYDHEYWMFAGRRELYSKVHQVTTRDTLMEHMDDVTYGMRPWQARHQAMVDQGIEERVTAADLHSGWLRSAEWGMGYALVQPPLYTVRVLNDDVSAPPRYFFAFWANDWRDFGVGTPFTVPALTTYFDHDVVVAWPFSTLEGSPEAALAKLVSRPSAVVGAAEARP